VNTDAEILLTIALSPVLIAYFSAPDCSVCKALLPKVEKTSHNSKGTKFLYISTKEHSMVTGQNMVFSVPTIIIFLGGKEVKRWVRNVTIAEIEMELERAKDTLNDQS
jgi:thioredoxin 1